MRTLKSGPFKILIENILIEFPSFFFIEKWMFININDHSVSAIFFDGPPTRFNMGILVKTKPLSYFDGFSSLGLHERLRIYVEGKYESDFRAPGFSQSLVDIIRSHVVPFAEQMKSFPAVIEYARGGVDVMTRTSWPEIRLAWCSTVEGKFDEARSYIEDAFREIEKYNLQRLLPTRRFQIMAELKPLLENGKPSEIGDFLRQLEREQVQYLKIEHLWKEAPFPFEVSP